MKTAHIIIGLFCCGTALLFSCSGNKTKDNPLNLAAALPARFGFSQKGYKVLTSFFNQKLGTVSMLYGNEKARQQAMDSSIHLTGSAWALVTWKTQDDKHWFGAAIPGELVSVETVTAGADRSGMAELKYSRYNGKDLVADPAGTLDPDGKRTRFITTRQPAIMP